MADKRFNGLCPCKCGCYIAVDGNEICYACQSDALSDARATGRVLRADAAKGGRSLTSAQIAKSIRATPPLHYADRAAADAWRGQD